MKTINQNYTNEIVINKSRFICLFIKVKNVDEVNNELNNLKLQYKDATHYCYAYIIDNIKRFNDDGEPGGTAGIPILNVLENNELNYVLCVVVRYFGGIKLGAGGLVRAYTKSVTSCLELISLIDVIFGYKISLTFNYENVKLIDNLLKNITIIDKDFNENINYTILISKEEFQNIKDSLEKLCQNINVIEDVII